MPPNTQAIYQSEVHVNGQLFPAHSWQVHVGTYGQLGRMSAQTSLKAMREYGIQNLANIAPDAYTDVQVTLNTEIIFGGTYFAGNPIYHEDAFEIYGRDHAAILFDTKRAISNLNLDNITVSQLVTQLANQYGLQPDVNIEDDPIVGTVVTQGSTMATYPQPLWNLLIYLARMTGAEVTTTPAGVLRFQTIGRDQTHHTVTWKAVEQRLQGPPAPNAVFDAPVLKLSVLHQPQRNRNFGVIVKSHHQKTRQFPSQTVIVNNQPITVQGTGKTLKAGFHSGAQGVATRGGLAGGTAGVPIYEFFEDGLTPDLAQARAEGYAREIAKRLYIWTIVVDGNPAIRPSQRITVEDSEEGSLYGMNANGLYITAVTHSLVTPQGEEIGGDAEGFLSTITALSLPPPSDSAAESGELFG